MKRSAKTWKLEPRVEDSWSEVCGAEEPPSWVDRVTGLPERMRTCQVVTVPIDLEDIHTPVNSHNRKAWTKAERIKTDDAYGVQSISDLKNLVGLISFFMSPINWRLSDSKTL